MRRFSRVLKCIIGDSKYYLSWLHSFRPNLKVIVRRKQGFDRDIRSVSSALVADAKGGMGGVLWFDYAMKLLILQAKYRVHTLLQN